MSILVKDKFLFTATSIPADTDATLSHAQLTEVMKVFEVLNNKPHFFWLVVMFHS